jgi:hypothetical protein
MQDNTPRGISAPSTKALDGHVLEQAAYHTQILYNLYCKQCCVWYFVKLEYSHPMCSAAKHSVMNGFLELYLYRAIE